MMKSPTGLLVRRMFRRRLVLIAAVVLLAIIAVAVAAPWLAPYAPNKMDIINRLKGPAGNHWFGTDEFGRDVLSRVMHGAQLSLAVGGAKIPAPEEEDDRARLEARAQQVRDLVETLDLLFDAFGQVRFSAEWPKQLARMQRWLSREEKRAA